MKVMILNPDGMDQAADEVKEYLDQEGAAADVISFVQEIKGCLYCGKCYRRNCCIIQDGLNEIIARLLDYDGLIVIVKPCYGEISEQCRYLLERLMHCDPQAFSMKPAAGLVASARNAPKALASLSAHFAQANMYVFTSQYGNLFCEEKAEHDRRMRLFVKGYVRLLAGLKAFEKEHGAEENLSEKTLSYLR